MPPRVAGLLRVARQSWRAPISRGECFEGNKDMYDASGFIDMTSSEEVARADAALLVRFEWVDVEDPEATKANGYACFQKKEFVRIRIPGSQEERFRKVTEETRRRFPRAYAAFKAGHAEVVDGTALKECPVLNASEVSMLNHHGVAAVEQVAALSDEQISNMGHGIRPIRDRVKSWWDARKSQRPIAELQAQLNKERAEKEAILERLAALEAGSHKNGATAAETPDKPAPKKRNRKPKAVPTQEG